MRCRTIIREIKKAFSISALKNCTELLAGTVSNINQSGTDTQYEPSPEESANCNFYGESLHYSDNGDTQYYTGLKMDIRVFALNAVNDNANYYWKEVGFDKIAYINGNNITDLVLSGWAKADSAFINRDRSTDYSYSE